MLPPKPSNVRDASTFGPQDKIQSRKSVPTVIVRIGIPLENRGYIKSRKEWPDVMFKHTDTISLPHSIGKGSCSEHKWSPISATSTHSELTTPSQYKKNHYSGSNRLPNYQEILSPLDLADPIRVISDLHNIDWSFTLDNTGFLTHNLHPYPAKYIPQIPGQIISRLSLRGELILDPFGGSGTTALEAVRLGRRAVSIDANPIGTLVGKVKTCKVDKRSLNELHAMQKSLIARANEFKLDPMDLCEEFYKLIPDIPNIEKWFPPSSCGELAFIRSCIATIGHEGTRNIAQLALSKVVLKVSFQDSETRYSSKPRTIPSGETINHYLNALEEIIKDLNLTEPIIRFGANTFITADTRFLSEDILADESVDLIVTSPPYGNANDYHLYHRFRLLWLGFSPRDLAKVEIGSHLKHQRESSGFESYLEDIALTLSNMYRVLKPGRYVALVIGDAIYKGVLYHGAESIGQRAEDIGFENLSTIERTIHETKRSFVSAGRRANTEKILLLRKPPHSLKIKLSSPPYKLWPFEKKLQKREIQQLLGLKMKAQKGPFLSLEVDPYKISHARKLVFSHAIHFSPNKHELNWQAILENGLASQSSLRKDPKYATHGLHPYKGKFYPQLAKGLINICAIPPHSILLDPFCGSGTTLLEGYLNGHASYGCDINPLAAKIAGAKTGILEIDPHILSKTINELCERIKDAKASKRKVGLVFNKNCSDEINSWFPMPVVGKLNWLLRTIRSLSSGTVQDFLEVILSSIIREVSQQDTADLRIRRRKAPLNDADVFGLFSKNLKEQYDRIEKFWKVRGYAPNKFSAGKVLCGDSRDIETFNCLKLNDASVDLILTSPPYATALPYIDTDRLSLLVLFGLVSTNRRAVEQDLIGSREIITSEKKELEKLIIGNIINLPDPVISFLFDLYKKISAAKVGFRRKNMPALLLRFFLDISQVLTNCFRLLKINGQALIVIGDNKIKINDHYETIPTARFVELIANMCGYTTVERIDISVTRENLIHINNAITKNIVLRFKKAPP